MNSLVFDEVAESYDRARPSYPDALIDDLIQMAAVSSQSRILEVGAGTGQATRSFARRGLCLVCLEPGVRLAAIARGNLSVFPRVSLINTSFESWSVEPDAFDLVVSAQAFHWVEPEVRFAKAHAALKRGGALAILTNVPSRGQSELDRDIDACYERFAPSHQSMGAQRRTQLEPQFGSCGLFQVLPVREYLWASSYSSGEYVELIRTYSDHHLLPEIEREALFEGIRQVIESRGGRLGLQYESRLLVGKRAV